MTLNQRGEADQGEPGVTIVLKTWAAALFAAVTATAFVLGRGFEHYCQFSPYRPENSTSMKGPLFSSPVTLRCWYDTGGWVSIPDGRPLRLFLTNLLVALLVASAVSAVVLIRRKRHPART